MRVHFFSMPGRLCLAPISTQEAIMQQRDHHDWTSDTYVEEWVQRQQAADPARAERAGGRVNGSGARCW